MEVEDGFVGMEGLAEVRKERSPLEGDVGLTT